MLFIKKSFIYKEEFGTVTKFNLNWKLVTKILEAYRKTPNISPGLIKNHKHFLMRLYLGDLYTEPLLCLEFFASAISFSRKSNGIRQKNFAPAAKYYFTT